MYKGENCLVGHSETPKPYRLFNIRSENAHDNPNFVFIEYELVNCKHLQQEVFTKLRV